MRVIQAVDHLGPESAEALGGTLLGLDSFDTLVREDAEVRKPDGTLLLKLRKGVLPAQQCIDAYPAIRKAAGRTDNRGIAGGIVTSTEELDRTAAKATRTRFRPLKEDGTVSKTSYAVKTVESGIIGYFDRSSRFPYCRVTAWNLDNPQRFAAAMPLIRSVDAAFRENVPDRYGAQRAYIERTHPDFTIHGTAFTTITVNRNWQTAVHQDAGDLKAGFGVLSVLEGGSYEGGYLVFPRYRVAADIRTRDVLFADVHEWHGNTPIVGVAGTFERISLVFYYREKMFECGSPAEELERAKSRRAGTPLNG